jgi:voltage-gated potassium channel
MMASKQKIIVFLFAVMSATIILGTLMYLIESKEAGFTSIPRSIYWAIVTLTTVGYGDIAPQTVLGQMIASFIMIIGYGIIAVPTGIVGAEISKSKTLSTQSCVNCSEEGHDHDAEYCKYCGEKL